MQLTVVTIENGVETRKQVEMSPEVAKLYEEMAAMWAEHGCKCEGGPDPTKYVITPRGHSVDVDCGVCGGMVQVG